MSYVNMDHAGWLESQIAAHKKYRPTKRDRQSAAEHKGWHAAPDKLNGFQRRAVDILGIVGGGIYNCPISWNTVYWDRRFIILSWWKGLATFDFMELTRFVFLCHEARIRGSIAPNGPRHLEIGLHERSQDGCISARHPDLAEALAFFRSEVPAHHPIIYRAPAEAAE